MVFEEDVAPRGARPGRPAAARVLRRRARQGGLARRQRQPQAARPARSRSTPPSSRSSTAPRRRRSRSRTRSTPPRRSGCSTATSTCAAPRCRRRCMTRARVNHLHPQLLRRAGLPRARDAVHGEVHAGRRPQLPGAVAASTPASSTRWPRARSSSSSSSWWRASTATSRSCAASATRTCASTASPSSPRSTSRCPSSQQDDIFDVIEGLIVSSGRRCWASRSRARSRACPSTSRWASTATTSPTCASAWSTWT